MKTNLFCSILFSFIVSIVYCQNDYCTEFPTQLGSDPIPELPKSFEVRVETNLDVDGRTQEMRLFYDYDQRKAAIELKEDNQFYKLIFNYETDEIFELNSPIRSDIYQNITPPNDLPLVYTECKAFPLKNTQGLNQYFSFSVVNGLLYPGPPSQPFQFKPQVYEGDDTVRGIPCDVYKSCLNDQSTTTKVLVRHYFSKESFSLSGSNNFFKRLPIKAVIEGALPPPSDGGEPIKFKRTLNYYDFRQDVHFRPNTFMTPSGVYCDQRRPTKDIPKKGSMLGYSQEIVSSDGVQYIKNVYVANDFLRFEIKNSQYQEATFYTLEPITFVNDYSLGLQYAINNNRGNCSLRPIVTDIFNQTFQTYNSVIDFAAQLQTTSNIFRPNSSYIFTGSKNSNGIISDRFITKNSKGIFEYTFSDSRFTIDNVNQPEKDVPVALYVENNQINISSYSSFYNFDSSMPRLELFDVGNCFTSQEKIDFTVVFNYKGLITKPQLDEQKDLNTQLLAQLYSLTQESTLRYSPPKIFVSNDGNIYAQVTIYPNPPALKLFVFVQSFFLVVPSFNTTRNVSTVDQCAKICVNDIRCLSFDFSKSGQSCHLNENHITDGSLVFQGDYFDHYSRNTDIPRLSREGFILYSLIENLISEKKLILNINVIKDKSVEAKLVPLVATKILKESIFDRFGTTEYLSRFRNVLPKNTFTNSKDQEYSGITIDDCARHCIDLVGAECKSFDFCFITGECRISRNPAPSRENTTEYMSQEYCDIYEKDALIHYDRFPASTVIDPKDILYSDIKSPNDCAAKCDNELKINCRSFNFCFDKRECYLSERHSPDIISSASTTNDLTCAHYSKRHLSDFLYTSSSNITLSAEIVLKDLSLERCSSACVGANGFNCKSFDYCPESRTCLLNSGQVAIDTKPTTSEKERDICGHYRREYFFATSQNVNLKSKDSDNSGVLIGLSIAFGVLSVLVGAIGTIYLFNKKRLK